MRTIAQVSVVMLASTLAPVVLAQSATGNDPISPFPYTPPPQYGSAPPDAESYAPTADEGAEYLEPDETIAEGYDDGYDPQASAEFQQALAPYGVWVDDTDYGQVWAPSVAIVGGDFLPYFTNGHWVLSEYGWTWVSDWSWGWAPFHYGRWLRTGSRGWCWVPGTTWGPAWVSWRSGSGYVGWAPLPPRGVTLAAAIPASGRWSPWRFTPAASLAGARASGLPPARVPGVFGRTTVVANDRLLTHGSYAVHVNAGPVRAAPVTPVRLATVAPGALPRAAILPRPGTSISARPWAGVAFAAGTARPGSGGGRQERRGGQLLSSPRPGSAAPIRENGVRSSAPLLQGSRSGTWGGAHAMAPLLSRPSAMPIRPSATAPSSPPAQRLAGAGYVAPTWRGTSAVLPPVASRPVSSVRPAWSGSTTHAYAAPEQTAPSRPVYAAPAARIAPPPPPAPAAVAPPRSPPAPVAAHSSAPAPVAAPHWVAAPAPVHVPPSAPVGRGAPTFAPAAAAPASNRFGAGPLGGTPRAGGFPGRR